MATIKDHLTGRYYQSELFPFSFQEYLIYSKVAINKDPILSTDEKSLVKSAFNKYFTLGGFPAYLKTENKQYLKSLYESILYRDVMVRNKLTNEQEILQLVHYIASNPAKLISYNSLASAIGVKNATTVKSYLNHLQDSYLVFLVNKYDKSIKKQIQNPKKAYFIDLGLIRELGFHHSEDNGRLLENLVFIELKRRAKEVYYHNQNKECDFVIKEKNKIVEAIQVSWSIYVEKTRKREFDGLLDALRENSLKEGLILTEAEEDIMMVDGYKVIIKPVWKWVLGV
jgi:predicted AAA+ superfamily ATPase